MRPADAAAVPPPDAAMVCDAEVAAALKELREIGMDLARCLREAVLDQAAAARAAGEPVPVMSNEAGLTFGRIARSVRLTAALERSLHQPPKVCGRGGGRDANADMSAQIADAAQRLRRKLWAVAGGADVRATVEKTIETQAEGREAERLRAELNEKLADDDETRALMGLPIREMIERVCEDLGLAPDPGLWEREPWAIEERATELARAWVANDLEAGQRGPYALTEDAGAAPGAAHAQGPP